MRFNVAAVLMVVAGSLGSLALTGCAAETEPSEEEVTSSSSDALVWAICHPGNPCSRCGSHDTYYWQDGNNGGWFCGAAVANAGPSQLPKNFSQANNGAASTPPTVKGSK